MIGQLIKENPQLTAIEEKQLATAALNGDAKAKDKLVLCNLKLVLSLARKYQHYESVDTNDLLQDGIIGLMKAIEKFEPNRGYRFSTYACWWIQQALLKSFSESDRLIRIPSNTITHLNQLKKAQDTFEKTHHRQPSIQELSQSLKMTPRKINRLISLLSKPISLEQQDNGNDESNNSPIQWLSTGESSHEEGMFKQQQKNTLYHCFSNLNTREKDILSKRYLFEEGVKTDKEGKWTLENLAKQYSITRESIRQSEKRALSKLRAALVLQEMYD
jgi:RNA polymerase primary sigma factor